MRTAVFQVPDRDLQVLVTMYDDGQTTIAFRPSYGSWGPPISAMSETREGSAKVSGGLLGNRKKDMP